MFYLDNRTKYKYDGHRPDPQVMDDKKMLHLAKSSTVSVRFQPEILNGNLSILYVVSPFTIIINYSKLSSIHSFTTILNSFIQNYPQFIHNYHQFIHPQSSSTDTLQSSRLYVVSRTFTIIFMKRQCLRQFTIIFMRR